ncbi:MAG: hypothetical protein Sapg2KO_27810 [Saprospiraceae bacterium]
MRTLFQVILFFLILVPNLQGQDLLKSPQHADYDYLFQLTNAQAEDLYQAEQAVDFDYQLLANLVDSIPFREKLNKNYAAGHYLRVRLDQDQVESELINFQYFQAHLLDNHRDFCLQVIDTAGQIIKDAEVKINNRKIRFDEATQSYRVAKANRQGRLSIERNGVVHFYEVTRRFNKSVLNRLGANYVKYGAIKYVWRPIKFIVAAPVEGIISLVRGRATPKIYRTGRFFSRLYDKVICVFDPYYCNDYKNEDKYSGYLVTNKPIYRPGDTLRWKAFLVKTKSGKAYEKPLDVYLWDKYPKKAKSLNHSSVSPGTYHGYFILADSLDLQLDWRLSLSLDQGDKTLLRTSVKYEDYELKKNEFTIQTDREVHYQKDSIELFIKATDDNELPLADARIELLAKITSISAYTADSVFIPDTLFYLEQPLSVLENDAIFIPTVGFPKANFSYNIKASLKTTDNELRTETLNLDFWDRHEALEHRLANDAILFEFKENDKAASKELQLRIEDPFGLVLTEKRVELPYQMPIETYAANYIFTKTNESWSRTVSLSQDEAGLSFLTERQGNQIQVQALNPHQLPFNYFFYELNQEKAHGFTQQLDTTWSVKPSKNAYLSVQYLWNGRMISQDYQVPVKASDLQITTNLPATVNPGESQEIEIQVKDSDGVPISDVDLTAFSITRKFENYYTPTLPDLRKPSKQRKIYNEFTKKEKDPQLKNTDLEYQFWNPIADLEENEYYNFRFPQDSVYRYSYPTVDSTTQFAPFFGGEPIHVIEVDRKPVYFSWTNHEQPYAFPIRSGYHQIRLRLSDRMVVVDSLYFPAKQKTILGMGENMRKNLVRFEDREKDHLSKSEEATYWPFLMFYQTLQSEKPYFLKQKNDHILSLSPNDQLQNRYAYNNFRTLKLAGPVYKGNLNFQLLEGFQLNFAYEPGYEYQFEQQLLKMISKERKGYFPTEFSKTPISKLKEEALSVSKLEQRWAIQRAYQLRTKPVYSYPKRTNSGKSTLTVKLKADEEKAQSIFHRMLIPLDLPNEFQVVPGGNTSIYNLETGWHRLYLFYEDQSYAMLDSLWVQNDGESYYQKAWPELLTADSFSIKTIKEISKAIFNQQSEKTTLQNIQQNNQTAITFPASWDRIQGYIYDEDGAPLIGASILIKGTTIGTVTDLDGFYSLPKPPDSSGEIIVSYTGFETKEFSTTNDRSLNVILKPSQQLLEEVVVTGYGVQRKRAASAAVVTQDAVTGALLGVSAGIQLTEAKAITIRGATSLSAEAQPLIIIDGVIFTGKLSDLSEDQIKTIEVLKGDAATAIYGARAVDGVLLIGTKDGKYRPNVLGEKAELEGYLENTNPGSSLRSNFKDDAFWEPALRTDAQGKARFTATFPDDITNWRVMILAMNDRKQSQQYETSIKAYKALLAQLSVPRFLVAGDTSQVIGKTLNYGQDTLQVQNQFLLNEVSQNTKARALVNVLIDTLQINTPDVDTLDATYLVERSDGYLDGEKRRIPIIKRGLTAPEGTFLKVKSDTTIFLQDFQPGTPVLLRVDIGRQNTLQNSIDYLKDYQYECNEQMASKLIAHLIDQQLKGDENVSAKSDRAVRRLVKILTNNQNAEGGWGWWNRSGTSTWISKHVREALAMAEQAGYPPNSTLKSIRDKDLRVFDLETDTIPAYLLGHLEYLHLLDEKVDFPRYLEVIKNTNLLSFSQQLQWWRLSQDLGLTIDLTALEKYLQKDAFGNTFFTEETSNLYRWLPDQSTLQNTLTVIELLHQDSSRADLVSSSIDYLLKQRLYWNTYDRARFLKIVGPIVAQEMNASETPQVLINGVEVKDYPFKEGLSQEDSLRIEKRGPAPVYLSLTQDYYQEDPQPKTDLFTVSTTFKDSLKHLSAGDPTELLITLDVHQEADYVWVKVPIPAACSYNGKPSAGYPINHVEYYKDHAIYYFNRLAIGQYKMSIPLQPRYAGNYQLNPAQAALMYFPVLSGNNAAKRVKVN